MKTLTTPQAKAANTVPSGPQTAIALGKFANQSPYMRGLFSTGIDQLGSQAQTILLTHLQQSQRYRVLDRANTAETQREALLQNKPQTRQGAAFVISGDVTAFGRKEVGDQQLFGLLGRGKTQVAFANVTLHLVDTETQELIHSTQGAGEVSLSEREVLGFGGTAGYDASLNGKVLDLAIREAVDALVTYTDSHAGAATP